MSYRESQQNSHEQDKTKNYGFFSDFFQKIRIFLNTNLSSPEVQSQPTSAFPQKGKEHQRQIKLDTITIQQQINTDIQIVHPTKITHQISHQNEEKSETEKSQNMKASFKIILALSVLIVVGFTWNLDMPVAIEVPLREEPYNFSSFQYNFLYFATFIAITFSDMPVGMLLDKFPIKRTIIVMGVVSLLSNVGILLMFNFKMSGYKVLIYIFRGIFGITGQALFTIQALLISVYSGKYYDLLIGAGICLPFLFNSTNNVVTPVIYDQTNSMELVWGVVCIFCGLALVCCLIISFFVTREEKIKQQNAIQQGQLINQQERKAEEQINFDGLKTMPKEFWVIVGAVFLTELVFGLCIDNLNDSMVKRFNISYVDAGYLMFIPYGAAAIICFLLGLLLNVYPTFRRPCMAITNICYSAGLLFVYFLPNVESEDKPTGLHYIVIIFQLFTISAVLAILYGVLSASIVYVIQLKHLGIGWGVIGSTCGLSSSLAPLIIAWILDSEEDLAVGYKKCTFVTFFVSLGALAFSCWIVCGSFEKIDTNAGLNESSDKKSKQDQERKNKDHKQNEQNEKDRNNEVIQSEVVMNQSRDIRI